LLKAFGKNIIPRADESFEQSEERLGSRGIAWLLRSSGTLAAP
jgi:hypothetical protein